MRYLFIIQGEGRGHMTQALALSQILRSAGHEICRVVVGKSQRRELPSFFVDRINAPIDHLDSPNFVTDKNQKSVKPFKSVLYSILNSQTYQKSLKSLHQIISEEKPDVIINFYDFLGGLYAMYKKPPCKMVSIAHQFLIAHPTFNFPERRKIDKASLKLGNRIAGFGADKILALSFRPFEDVQSKKLFVVPPLLREEIKSLEISSEEHLLVYMVNPGYAEEVMHFHKNHPEVALHCFWDKKGSPQEWKIDDNLTFHQLDDRKFLSYMSSSKGYVTTAGFESVCEAMYLGKPVLMVPVEGHYEQACNALDAKGAGAGIYSDSFNIELLLRYLSNHFDVSVPFRNWADQAHAKFLDHLTQWS